MIDREELFEELLSYLDENSEDTHVAPGGADASWVAAETLQKLIMADIYAKEEFLEIPAFEEVMTEEGPQKRPNQALKRILEAYSENVADAKPWEKGSQLFGLMSERQRLAEAWGDFGWKRQPKKALDPKVQAQKLRLQELEMLVPTGDKVIKVTWPEESKLPFAGKPLEPMSLLHLRDQRVMPKISEQEKILLEDEDKAPDPSKIETYRTKSAGSWVVYSPHEKEHFDLNVLTRKGWATQMYVPDRKGNMYLDTNPGAVAAQEQEDLDSQNDLTDRDDMDMVLKDYPVHHSSDECVREWKDDFEDLVSKFPYHSYTHEVGFCAWLREHGGKKKLHDIVDNLKYYQVHAPRASVEPIVMIKGIKVLNRTWVETRISLPTHVPGSGWGYMNKDGRFRQLNTEFIVNRAKSLLSRWLCEEPTLRPRLNARNSGLIQPIGPDASCSKYKEFKSSGLELRQAHCTHCSSRVGERGDWYWNMVNSHRGMFATQYVNSGDFGVHTLHVKDNTDCRWTQQKLLGDNAFASEDTWKIQGKTGDWRCLLCGRTKIFRAYYVLMQWTTGPAWTEYVEKDNGAYLEKSYGKSYVVKIRIAGEDTLDRMKNVLDGTRGYTPELFSHMQPKRVKDNVIVNCANLGVCPGTHGTRPLNPFSEVLIRYKKKRKKAIKAKS